MTREHVVLRATGCVALTLVMFSVGLAGQAPGLTQPYEIIDLGLGDSLSTAAAINERGEVVFNETLFFFDSPGFAHSYFWTRDEGRTPLGGGPETYAVDVNANGRVIGNTGATSLIPWFYPDRFKAFAWTRESGMVLIPEITSIPPYGARSSSSYATAVNAGGDVVVRALWELYKFLSGEVAFIWSPESGVRLIPGLGGWATSAAAADVNDGGQVVGRSFLPDGTHHAFSWTVDGGTVDLGTLGGLSSWATDINDVGQVIGQSRTASGAYHAFLWTAQDGMIDLGTLGGDASRPLAINRAGQVVGESWTTDGTRHAFSWTREGGMIDLGTLGGTESGATAVNDEGSVVGFSSLVGDGSSHAFVWTADEGMIDLGTLGGRGSVATSINNRGQIAGWSHTGEQDVEGREIRHATLWDRPDTAPPVITVPPPLVVEATTSAGAIVTFVVTATDPEEGPVPVTCVPASGSTFLIGTTTVTCTATDTAGNIGTASFTVRVLSGQEMLANLIEAARSANFGQAVNLLGNALRSVQTGNAGAACNQISAFMNQVRAQTGKQLTAAQAAQWLSSAARVTRVMGCS